MAHAIRPCTYAPTKRRCSYNGRSPMARKSMASSTYRVGVPRDGPSGSPSLVSSRAAARTRYNRQATLARHCLPDSRMIWLYLCRGTLSATLTMFSTRQRRPVVHSSRPAMIRSATRSKSLVATTHGPTRCALTCTTEVTVGSARLVGSLFFMNVPPCSPGHAPYVCKPAIPSWESARAWTWLQWLDPSSGRGVRTLLRPLV
jgi:hypothetical protein